MSMHVVLPEQSLPARLTLNPEMPMNDDEYYAFCVANPDLRFERTAKGEIIIVPPAGGESDFQSMDGGAQLRNWARRDTRGRAFGSSVAFILSTRAVLSPDAAWVSNERLALLSKEQRRKFLPISPEFVVEVMSPSDRLPAAKEKMEEWLRGGVELAWLIDGDERTVHIYRIGALAEAKTGITKLSGEGPVAGFELDLTDIWAGL
jgi:Uma2 family endonuclease